MVMRLTFRDYFQMSTSTAKLCFSTFVNDIINVYGGEYLALPTKGQVNQITTLHEKVHGVSGMFGSLDCMHCTWHRCPKAYHGAFQGSKRSPTIVLEAACDYNMYIWHAAFGFPGKLNDINVLNLSPLATAFLDGSLAELEAMSVQFCIGEQEFNSLYLLVDGIYPK